MSKSTLSLILLSVSVVSFLFLTTSSASADDVVVDNVALFVPISCSLSGTGTGTHRANITNGTYSSEIGTTTLKAYCNDSAGFAIYAIGFTGNQYTGDDHTKLIGNNSNQKIITGTATSAGNPDVSNWAMKLATNSGATYPMTIDNSFNNYSLVPSSYTKVAHRDSGTDIGVASTGAELTTTYAVYIAKNQPADSYHGRVKYTLVHPANSSSIQPQETTSGQICYYPNTSVYEGTMGCQTVENSDTTKTLLATNYSKNGYGFAGWSDASDYETNSDAHFYGPQQIITFNAGDYTGSNSGLSLYAVWVPSVGILQDNSLVSGLCASDGSLTQAPIDGTAGLTSVSALTDARDGQTYAIAKLSDGECWMIENLRLESSYTTREGDESLSQGYGSSSIYGNFVGLADAQNSALDFSLPNSVYYGGTQSGTATVDIGTSNYPNYRMPVYSNVNTQSRATGSPNSDSFANNTSGGMYSYGNYYTWSAAMANTINYGDASYTDADGKTSETVSTSICPNGWRLPYGRSTGNGNTPGGFYYLNYKLNNDSNVTNATASGKIRSFPNNFVLSGFHNTAGNNQNRGSSADYWSATSNSGTIAYTLYFTHSTVYPARDTFHKTNLFSVRCVASIGN